MADESPAAQHLPFKTEAIRLGGQGINLAKASNGLDSLDTDELARMTNVLTGQGAGVSVRLGATRLQTLGAGNVHSCQRLYSPNDGATTHFWGKDGSWIRAEGASVGILEGGFSGDPIMMVQWATELGGLFKVYVADSLKMRRAGFTSASQQIGLPKPPQPTSVVGDPAQALLIAGFFAGDNSQAANWVPSGGLDVDGTGTSDPPILSNAVTMPDALGVNMAALIGTAKTSYPFWMNLPRNLNLNSFNGVVPATDDDIIHFLLSMDFPQNVIETRIYFVVSPFDASALPGVDPTRNAAAYVRSFRTSDYTPYVVGQQTADQAADQVRTSSLLQGFFDPKVTSGAIPSTTGLPGANNVSNFGTIGLPVRKGDFIKIGSAGQAGTDWSTVTGIVVYCLTNGAVSVNVTVDQMHMIGGYNVDTSEVDAQPLDYRITDYDTLTGARSNPSDVMTTTIDVMRQKVRIQPVAKGQVGVIQEAYRRGGNLVDNWYFVADNTATGDGTPIIDNTTEESALAAGAVEIDHDQPVTTVDQAGNTVLAQPVPVLFGPIGGYLFACGDPFRPGFLYWSKRNEPDHWPSENSVATCPPEEELMNGGEYGGGGFVFSRQRLYTIQINLMDGGVSTNPTDCAEGLFARYGMCIGHGGLNFVARDAIRQTAGGMSIILSDNIRPLFNNEPVEGYQPIDFTQPKKIRLELHGDDLWFGFQDTAGARVWWVFSFTYKTWRFAQFLMGGGVGMVYSDPTSIAGLRLILGGATSGNAYTHDGVTDDGTPVTWEVRTGAMSFGNEREEKLLGDLAVWGNLWGSQLTATAILNNETVFNTPFAIVGSSVEDRYLFDVFGINPQHAQTVSVGLTGTGSGTGTPYITKLGLGVAIQPEITMNRATTWEPMGQGGEVYLTGCWIDSDTFGTPRTIFVEGLLNGLIIAVSTLTVNSNNGRRQWFSWPAVHVDMIRLRPSGNCIPWMLFGQGWLATQEPPRIAIWDTGMENHGDTYYTGVDIECDTFNVQKTLRFFVDQVLISTQTIQTAGRKLVHITFQAGRGHIYQFVATDLNNGLLYSHKWILDQEPGEQTNWNQNYTIAGTLTDKYLKGILLECDTFGVAKTVTVEADGVVIATLAVTTNGRKVQHLAFPQALGRVFRIYPTDANPGRLYSSGWLFDEEPYQLTRYETQEQPDGIMDFHVPVSGQIAIKSTAIVTMQVTAYGQSGQILSTIGYPLPSTANVKGMISLHTLLQAQKGILFKYVFSSANGFWLYREESWIAIQPTGGGAPVKSRVFGDDDLDPARPMRDATLSAARSSSGATGNSVGASA